MKSTSKLHNCRGRLLIWLVAALGLYFIAYGYQLFVDFMFIDDYAILADDINLFDVKGSGRWLYYHFLNLMNTVFNHDPSRLILLRATSLLVQLVFFAILFCYLIRADFGVRLAFAAVLFLASLPQVQIFSVWLIALPFWCALTLMLAALVWLEAVHEYGPAVVLPAWALFVTAALAALLINQTLYLVGAGFLTVLWIRRALHGLSWIRFASWGILALCTSISIYALLLTLLGNQLEYTAAKQEYLNTILSGERAFWVELAKSRLGMAFHVFNSFLSERTAAIFWLPSLFLAIWVVFRKTYDNAAGSKLLALAAPVIAVLFLLSAIYIFLLLGPYKDSHRLYLPATVVIWGFLMLALSTLFQHVRFRRLSEWTVILISVFSLYSASMAVDRGIIKPSVLELNHVRNSVIAADLKQGAKLYMRMPDGLWIEHPSAYMRSADGDSVPMRSLPNTGLYWYRLSSRWDWVPKGMLQYVLKELDVPNWKKIEIQFGRREAPAGYTTIDMRHLKNVLVESDIM